MREDLKAKEHWHTTSHLFLAEHPFYKRITSGRLNFINKLLNDYIRNVPTEESNSLCILDAGCGDGVVLNMLLSKGYRRVTGCEYNFNRAKKAYSKFPEASILNASLTECSFKAKTFHVIIMNQVLEHIKDDVSVLNNLKGMLRDDGMLIIGVPNEGCFLGKMRNNFVQPWIQKQTDHVHFYTNNEISVKIKRAGFRITQLSRDGFMFPYTRINDLLASFSLGFIFLSFLGRIFKSQCGGLYFVCKKAPMANRPIRGEEPIYTDSLR